MDHEDEFLYVFFTYVSQLSFDKAKEHVEKERETCRNAQLGPWSLLLAQLPQIALVEKSYTELGFLQNKNKGFLRKDNSLRAIYDSIRLEVHRLEEIARNSMINKTITSMCSELVCFLSGRIDLIDFYEKVYLCGTSRQISPSDLLVHIEDIIAKHSLLFSHIALTPIKGIYSLECEILAKLLKAFVDLQNMHFLPTLALIYGATTRLTAWEQTLTLQNRESWKIGKFLKTNTLPPLFQWLMRLRGAVLSKFSLYFYGTLYQQIPTNDMRQLCSKLYYDHYQKITSFQRRYDAICVMLICEKTPQYPGNDNDNSPIIISSPAKPTVHLDFITKIIADKSAELAVTDRIVYDISQQCTTVSTMVEPNTYLAILFEAKKTEKELFIRNFISELVLNLRCSKIFASIKNFIK